NSARAIAGRAIIRTRAAKRTGKFTFASDITFLLSKIAHDGRSRKNRFPSARESKEENDHAGDNPNQVRGRSAPEIREPALSIEFVVVQAGMRMQLPGARRPWSTPTSAATLWT